MLLNRDHGLLMVIDVQERLAPATADPETVIGNSEKLLTAAARLGIPVIVTEQYPKGLGGTVAALRDKAPKDAIMDKVHFSCAGDERIRERLEASGRWQVVITGMEAHVCVAQTALALRNNGFDVAVVADAVTSRDPANKELALARLREAGVTLIPTESVLFEWLGNSQDPAFKELTAMIK
jgi:nicotinamidase-related amidase